MLRIAYHICYQITWPIRLWSHHHSVYLAWSSWWHLTTTGQWLFGCPHGPHPQCHPWAEGHLNTGTSSPTQSWLDFFPWVASSLQVPEAKNLHYCTRTEKRCAGVQNTHTHTLVLLLLLQMWLNRESKRQKGKKSGVGWSRQSLMIMTLCSRLTTFDS